MKNEKITASFDGVLPGEEAKGRIFAAALEKERSERARRRGFFIALAPVAAVAVIGAAAALGLFSGAPAQEPGAGKHLKLSKTDAKVKEVKKAGTVAHSGFDLVPLTEEELINGSDGRTPAIFEGTVESLSCFEANFSSSGLNREYIEYFSVVNIRVSRVLRGGFAGGGIVSVLVHAPIGIEGVWQEDTEVAGNLKAGVRGIFMAREYSTEDFFQYGEKRLYHREFAEYGFPDGERYLFLETERGTVFADWAYPSLDRGAGLEEIRAFLLQTAGD